MCKMNLMLVWLVALGSAPPALCWHEPDVARTDRPIVGVLAQELPQQLRTRFPNRNSYIPASYVKALESSGARVVPIFIRKFSDYYQHIVSSVNGVVFPGGNVSFDNREGYAAAGSVIYKIAKELQASGVNFPILGVCQGFELLVYLDAHGESVQHIPEQDFLVKCNSSNEALPLTFRDGFHQSRLYEFASYEILNILGTQNVTSNHHRYCVTEPLLYAHNLQKTWRVLSTDVDVNGLEFISSSERFDGPIVGLQFHPEKNMFEWNPKQANPHSRKAILSARHFYDWLVMESRANNQSFADPKEELSSLIYNFSPEFTGKSGGYDEQLYLF